MSTPEIPDPLFREAVAALDAGDVGALEALLAKHPELVRDRLGDEEYGEAYFRHPYLLWFVAENPIRHGKLPRNIAQVTRAILRAAEDLRVDSLQEQLDYALALVCSGRVPRESGVQRDLIDALCDAGAAPGGALMAALSHRELDAAERLLDRGAELTLLVAACMGRMGDVTRLLPKAGADDLQAALIAAAFHGQPRVLALLAGLEADLNAYGPEGFHPHATALHQAVDSGSLDAVKVLVEAGADLGIRDRLYEATPLMWAEYLPRPAIAAYLQEL